LTVLRWFHVLVPSRSPPDPLDSYGTPVVTSEAAEALRLWQQYSAAISEGFCPRCRVRLQPDTCCPTCDWYWRVRPATDTEVTSVCGGVNDLVIEAEAGSARRGEEYWIADTGSSR
jgi:hypothetical protein